MCRCLGAGQVLTGTRMLLAFSWERSLSPSDRAWGQPSLCSGPSPALGTSHPTGLQEGAFQHLPRCPLAGRQPRGGTRWAEGAGDTPSTRHPQAWHGHGSVVYLFGGISSLFKAFCSSLFTTSLPRLTHIFGAERCIFWGEQSSISALSSLQMPFVFHISDPGGCCHHHPPHPPSPLSCLGQGPLGFFLHLPEIKPGLFHP